MSAADTTRTAPRTARSTMGGARGVPPRPAPDQSARDRIVTDIDRSLLVEAGAGSGKTTSLVDRMVALVSTGTADVEEIAAVTFTRKAAAELAERFQESLEGRILEETDPETLARLDRALHRMDRGFTGTIHAFCARLLRERPIEAGLDPGFREVVGPEEREMRREFWLQYLEALRRARDPGLVELERAGLRPDDLYEAFGALSEHPDVAFPAADVDPPDPTAVNAVREELERLLDEALVHMPQEKPDPDWDALQTRINELRTSRDVFGWDGPAMFLDALGPLLEKNRTAFGKRWGAGKAGLALARGLQKRFDEFCHEDGPARTVLDRWWAYRYGPAIRFAGAAASAYGSERLRTGRLTFEDLLIQAARLLRTNPETRRDLADRYRFLLVDEFQDTDPVQAEVLFLLASEDPDETDWRKADPRPGALFVVGDPKQSIYRFRRADIAVYNEVRERFRLLEASGMAEIVSLTANFRSKATIAEFVNRQFEPLFPENPISRQAPFAPMQTHRSDAQGGSVQWYEVSCDKENQTAIAEADAAALATWIRERIDRGERRPGDFLILPYRRRHLSVYARALEARGVPVQVTGAEILIEEEIHELRILLEALVDPDHPILTAAVLVGLFFGLDYESLVAHRLAGGRFRFHREPPDESTEVGRALTRMREWWRLARRAPADVTVAAIVDELGLVPYAASGELGGARAGSLAFLLDTIRNLVLDGKTSLRDALLALDAVLELGEAETPLEPGRRDVVRVMNLHKAKGTEAPVVVLAHPTGKLDREPRRRIDRAGGHAVGAIRVMGRVGRYGERILAQPEGWRDQAVEEKSFEDAELVRLLYVATTRARDELVVGRFPRKDRESMWQPLYRHLEDSWEVLELPCTDPPPRPEASLSADEIRGMIASIASRRDKLADPSYEASPVTERVEDGAVVRGRGRGRDWGSAVHQALEAASEGVAGEALVRVCRAALLEHDRPTKAGEPRELDELVRLVERVSQSELLRRARAAERTLHEVPFALPRWSGSEQVVQEGVAVDGTGSHVGQGVGADRAAPLEILEGVIDLAFREEDGWVIADYKTDEIADETTLRARLEMYRRQVDLYAECWEALTREPVKERVLYLTARDRIEAW